VRLGIHQPNFMPRAAWFDKLRACDDFVLLGHCQFEKGKYQNRFHIGEEWFTMSVEHGMKPIREKRYSNPKSDWDAIKKRLPQHPVLSKFDDLVSESLWQTNCAIIRKIADMLGIQTPIHEDFPTEFSGTDRLVELCIAHDADIYLAGTSGGDYMDMTTFEDAGITVEFQDKNKLDARPILELLK